MDILKVFKEER